MNYNFFNFITLPDCINNLKPFIYFSKAGMLSVEMLGIVSAVADEELRPVRALGPTGDGVAAQSGVGHREFVGSREGQLPVDLVVEVVAGAAGALTERVAALDHEAGDDPVEDEAVVELGRVGATRVVLVLLLATGETGEVGDGLGGLVREQLDDDGPVVGVQSCLHAVDPLMW